MVTNFKDIKNKKDDLLLEDMINKIKGVNYNQALANLQMVQDEIYACRIMAEMINKLYYAVNNIKYNHADNSFILRDIKQEELRFKFPEYIKQIADDYISLSKKDFIEKYKNCEAIDLLNRKVKI